MSPSEEINRIHSDNLENSRQMGKLSQGIAEGSIPEDLGNALLDSHNIDNQAHRVLQYYLNAKGINNLFGLADSIARKEKVSEAMAILQNLSTEKNTKSQEELIKQLVGLAK